MKRTTNYTQIFKRSHAYGAPYYGEELPKHHWQFPTDTWLQSRRADLKRTKLLYDNVIYLNQMVEDDYVR